jgi:hypothetical protein
VEAALLRPPLALALALLALGGCVRAQPHPVRIVLSLHGARGRPVHGLDLTVALPAGSTVAHDASTGRISADALSLRRGAAGATLDGRFVFHPTTPSIRILLASEEPMRDGEVATVDATVTSTEVPSRGRFEVASAAVAGGDGASVPGATGWVSAVEPR